MEYFWAALAATVVGLILYGLVSTGLRSRRLRLASQAALPTLTEHLQADRRYNVFLSHGRTLSNVTFLGLSPTHGYSFPDLPDLPFPLAQWLILETEDGRRVFVKPHTVRLYEECDPRS